MGFERRKKTKAKAAAFVESMKDPYCILGMTCLLLLLETSNALVVWVQKRDAYICDFVIGLVKYQGTLFRHYEDQDTAFGRNDFKVFQRLMECSYGEISLRWQTDKNVPQQYLAFTWGTRPNDSVKALHEGQPITRSAYADNVPSIKSARAGK